MIQGANIKLQGCNKVSVVAARIADRRCLSWSYDHPGCPYHACQPTLLQPCIKLLILSVIVVVSIAPACAPVCFAKEYWQVRARPEQAPAELLSRLKSPDAKTRRDAANQLGATRARSAARALAERISDKDASVREAAAFALAQIVDPVVIEKLTRALADKDPEVRASAAFALGMTGDRKAIPALSKSLDDTDSAVRAASVMAFGLMQDTEAVDELIAMLDDPSFDVRYDTVWALGQIGEPDADGPVRAAIVELDLPEVTDSLRESFRQAAQNALENLRTEEKAQAAPAPRPRRATGVISESNRYSTVTRPVSIRQTTQGVSTERAARLRISGSVKLRVLVAADGRAARAYVVRRLGHGLDQRAVEAILQYRFEPAMLSGLPQTSWIDLEVKF